MHTTNLSVRRLGIIGDVHAEDVRLQAAIEYLTHAGVDRIVAVGDIVDGYGDANACCDLLAQHQVLTIRGNHERWLLAGRMRHLPQATARATLSLRSWDYLAALPATAKLATPRGAMLLCHGTGEDDTAAVRPADEGYALENNTALQAVLAQREYTFVLSGHTHTRMVRTLQSPRKLTLVNAGTLYRAHDPCFALADLATGTAIYFDIADPSAIFVAQMFNL